MSGSSGSNDSSLKLVLAHPLLSFLAAFRFLSIFPVSWKSEDDATYFRASIFWFPLIGLLIGSAAFAVVFAVAPFLTQPLEAVLALVLLSGISGFLHLDGVADSGDGLLSSRPREKALSIMRDSRSGAMGVIVLLFLILGKYAALSSLPTGTLLPVILLMPVAGRTAILLSMAVLPYAREDDGLGKLFYGHDRFLAAALAVLFLSLCCLLVSLQWAVAIIIALLCTVMIFSRWCFVKLGGATGDTLGAVCELSELTTAVAIVCLQGAG